jgi:hypothetical protein
MQKNNSSIADVIPALKIMFSRWNRLQVFGNAKAFCTSLINWHKKKFTYELNSDVYKTASLLNTSKLPLWYQRDDCSNTLESSANSLVDVAHHFLKNESKQNTPSNDHGFQNIIDDTNKNDRISD